MLILHLACILCLLATRLSTASQLHSTALQHICKALPSSTYNTAVCNRQGSCACKRFGAWHTQRRRDVQHGHVTSAHQVADPVTLKDFAHFCGLMLSIHGPERVNGASSCQHDASTTSRMLIDLPDKKRINRDDLALKAEHKHDARATCGMLIDLSDQNWINRE